MTATACLASADGHSPPKSATADETDFFIFKAEDAVIPVYCKDDNTENGTICPYAAHSILIVLSIRLANIFHVSSDYLLGIERTKTIDVSDLYEEEIKLLYHTVEVLRRNRG